MPQLNVQNFAFNSGKKNPNADLAGIGAVGKVNQASAMKQRLQSGSPAQSNFEGSPLDGKSRNLNGKATLDNNRPNSSQNQL